MFRARFNSMKNWHGLGGYSLKKPEQLLSSVAPALPASPASIQSLDHVGILVADTTRSVEFYREILGLKEIPSHFPGARWMEIAPGAELHLIPGRRARVTDGDSHFAFATLDLGPVIERLDAHHVLWGNGRGIASTLSTRRTDGVLQIFLEDPDGYLIEINDALKER